MTHTHDPLERPSFTNACDAAGHSARLPSLTGSSANGGWHMLNLSEVAALEKRKNNIRRSTRLSRRIPIAITSLDPAHSFSGKYETAVVNAHGCGIVLPTLLETGTPVSVELISNGRSKNGRIVLVISIAEG